MILVRKITFAEEMKLQGVVIYDQLLVNHVFQAYFCNSGIMNREKGNPCRGNIANRGDINRNITYLYNVIFNVLQV